MMDLKSYRDTGLSNDKEVRDSSNCKEVFTDIPCLYPVLQKTYLYQGQRHPMLGPGPDYSLHFRDNA